MGRADRDATGSSGAGTATPPPGDILIESRHPQCFRWPTASGMVVSAAVSFASTPFLLPVAVGWEWQPAGGFPQTGASPSC
jgi:hypothetical protein